MLLIDKPITTTATIFYLMSMISNEDFKSCLAKVLLTTVFFIIFYSFLIYKFSMSMNVKLFSVYILTVIICTLIFIDANNT